MSFWWDSRCKEDLAGMSGVHVLPFRQTHGPDQTETTETDRQTGTDRRRQTRQPARQAGRQADRQTDRPTCRPTDRPTGRQRDRPTDLRQTDRQTDVHAKAGTYACLHKCYRNRSLSRSSSTVIQEVHTTCPKPKPQATPYCGTSQVEESAEEVPVVALRF